MVATRNGRNRRNLEALIRSCDWGDLAAVLMGEEGRDQGTSRQEGIQGDTGTGDGVSTLVLVRRGTQNKI